jgi:predicted 3-demethylubiquinone-9 3-methyltransferase (glyoxalase superfamily)
MKNITPFLWFDQKAEEAINFYTCAFTDSQIAKLRFYGSEGPGKKDTVKSAVFRLSGVEFMAIDGGPVFSFTPAVSFFVRCDTEQEADELWRKLSDGGKVLMAYDNYPFLEKYGWIQDKFGVSWQLALVSGAQKIVPLLMYTGAQNARAEEAMNFYVSIFPDSSIATVAKYGPGEGGTEGSVKHGRFALGGQEFMAMDSSIEHDFNFTPAISLMVQCETQQEIDKFWEALSADGGEQGVCGWLKDKFGVSWQVIPTILEEMLDDHDAVKAKRVMQAMLAMKKIDIEGLRKAQATDNL